MKMTLLTPPSLVDVFVPSERKFFWVCRSDELASHFPSKDDPRATGPWLARRPRLFARSSALLSAYFLLIWPKVLRTNHGAAVHSTHSLDRSGLATPGLHPSCPSIRRLIIHMRRVALPLPLGLPAGLDARFTIRIKLRVLHLLLLLLARAFPNAVVVVVPFPLSLSPPHELHSAAATADIMRS